MTAPDVLSVDPAPRVGVWIAVVAVAAVLVGLVAVRWSQPATLTADQVRSALALSFSNRRPPIAIRQPSGPGPAAVQAVPEACGDLVLRPWLVDAWPANTRSGSQTGAQRGDALTSFEVITFTTANVREAREVAADISNALYGHLCDTTRIRPGGGPGEGYDVTIAATPVVPPPIQACTAVAFTATASSPPPGSPRGVTVHVLQFANTISLMTVSSRGDGQPTDTTGLPESERPSLNTLCLRLGQH